jgi:ubiquinone/menaquinone biosynthesis C-methylase UbiE
MNGNEFVSGCVDRLLYLWFAGEPKNCRAHSPDQVSQKKWLSQKMRAAADYGLDAPLVVRRLAIWGSVAVLAGVAFSFLPVTGNVQWLHRWAPSCLTTGLGCGLTAIIMTWGSRVGKLQLRDRVLAGIPWRGDEQVLDVGCGHGLMAIGAAKHLTSGKAVGIDIWQTEDQAGNSAEATRANVECEGVTGRVELRDADARALPFADGSFDVILSSWALHNIYDQAERQKAVREICRVLKPGGRVAVTDIRHASEYVREFLDAGLVNVRRSWPNFLFVTPTTTVFAQKKTKP